MSNRPNESNAQLYAEGTLLQGGLVTCILYGVVVVLSVLCWRSLWLRIRSHSTGRRKNILFFCCVIFLFIAGTVYTAFNMRGIEMTFINNRNFPGGMGKLRFRLYLVLMFSLAYRS